jgi:hypothetical protein
MASNKSLKVCEAEENACKREVQALCYHCSKNLCRVHLMQHAQLIEDKTQSELHKLADKFNELSSRFDHLSISDDILKEPLIQLEKWRTEAHAKIDQIVENKHQELIDELGKCRKSFLTQNEEQLSKMKTSKKMIAEFIQENDASTKQLADLQESINETEKYLNALNTPIINIITRPINGSVQICTNLSYVQATSIDTLRIFKVTYVRLNGLIRNYYIHTKNDGKISDLIQSFIRHYTTVEESTQVETNGSYTIAHLPKPDFILPVEIYNHRIHLQYSDNALLGDIPAGDVIIFYETPHSLNSQSNQRILMPCSFQRSLEKQPFGLPIYLSVPRTGCRGQQVLDALCNTLGNFFPLDNDNVQQSCDAYLEFTVGYTQKETKLTDALHDEIDFNKVNTKLIVRINSQTADKYEQNIQKQLGL